MCAAEKHASLGICIWGNNKCGETRIPATPVLADLKETLMSHVIKEFKFQQAIHKKRRFCTSITMLLELLKYKA